MINKIAKLLFKYNSLLNESIFLHDWNNCIIYDSKVIFLKNRLFNFYNVIAIDFTNKVLRFE